MRLTQLRSFWAVAQEGSFTRAAKFLHVSQPTVTTQVRFLEETYDIELFHRRGRSVRLTALGQQLFALAKQIFSLEQEAVHFLKDTGKLQSGHLRVGAVGPFHVTEMLAKFNQRYPHMQVSVRVGNSEEVVRALLDYQTDVAVLAQFNDDPRFHFVPYSRHPIVIFVHRKHRFARRKSIRIQELEGEPLIMREVGSTTRKALDDALKKAGVTPRIAMVIGSREAIREAVIKGVGIAAVSEIEYVADADIRRVTVRNAQMFTHAHVVCLEERRDARVVRAFLDIVAELQALSRRTTRGRGKHV